MPEQNNSPTATLETTTNGTTTEKMKDDITINTTTEEQTTTDDGENDKNELSVPSAKQMTNAVNSAALNHMLMYQTAALYPHYMVPPTATSMSNNGAASLAMAAASMANESMDLSQHETSNWSPNLISQIMFNPMMAAGLSQLMSSKEQAVKQENTDRPYFPSFNSYGNSSKDSLPMHLGESNKESSMFGSNPYSGLASMVVGRSNDAYSRFDVNDLGKKSSRSSNHHNQSSNYMGGQPPVNNSTTRYTLELPHDNSSPDVILEQTDTNEQILLVECGTNKAMLYVEKLCQGSKGKSILFQDNWLTPNEFQAHSGRETAKDWKRSIRHCGKSLKVLMTKKILLAHGLDCSCGWCDKNNNNNHNLENCHRKEEPASESVPSSPSAGYRSFDDGKDMSSSKRTSDLSSIVAELNRKVFNSNTSSMTSPKNGNKFYKQSINSRNNNSSKNKAENLRKRNLMRNDMEFDVEEDQQPPHKRMYFPLERKMNRSNMMGGNNISNRQRICDYIDLKSTVQPHLRDNDVTMTGGMFDARRSDHLMSNNHFNRGDYQNQQQIYRRQQSDPWERTNHVEHQQQHSAYHRFSASAPPFDVKSRKSFFARNFKNQDEKARARFHKDSHSQDSSSPDQTPSRPRFRSLSQQQVTFPKLKLETPNLRPRHKPRDSGVISNHVSMDVWGRISDAAEELSKWDVDDVCVFLEQIGLKDYKEVFRENCINGDSLPLLRESHLIEKMGMKLGHALLLIARIHRKLGSYFAVIHNQSSSNALTPTQLSSSASED